MPVAGTSSDVNRYRAILGRDPASTCAKKPRHSWRLAPAKNGLNRQSRVADCVSPTLGACFWNGGHQETLAIRSDIIRIDTRIKGCQLKEFTGCRAKLRHSSKPEVREKSIAASNRVPKNHYHSNLLGPAHDIEWRSRLRRGIECCPHKAAIQRSLEGIDLQVFFSSSPIFAY